MKIRFWILLTFAFLKKFKALILISTLAGVVLFLGARFMLPSFLSQTEYIGLAGRYRIEELPEIVLLHIGEGLTKQNTDGTVEASLAKSWESTDDGKTWIFQLDTSKVWHDGKPVTSETISYSFQDVTVEKPNKSVIIFKLKDPFAPFPTVVSKPTFKQGLLGTGDWKVDKLSLNSGFVEKIELKNEQGSKKVFKFFPSEDALKTAFKLGSIDTILDVLNPTPFKDWKNISIKEELTNDRYVAIFFNNQSNAFSGPNKKSLRQGLSYAVQKEELGKRALGPVSPDSWGYNPQVKDYKWDLDRAKELIGEIEDDNPLNLRLASTPTLLPIAEQIAQDWDQLGVTTQVQVVSSIPPDFEAFLAIYTVPSDPDQYSIWHASQIESGNIANYQNPRINKLLEDGRLELNQEKRKKIYLDFQRFLLEDAPAIFLYHPISYTISRN